MLAYRRIALALSPFSLLSAASSAGAQDVDRMDQIVSASAEEQKFMGTALVAIGDEIVLRKAYGSADLEWGIANTTETKFRIGSVTKQFTAASILLLQERGQIDIDRPVKTYWPESPAAWDKVTVKHLMTHTAGLPSITQLPDFKTFKYLPTSRDELIARFAQLPLEFEPGEKFNYSNSGYLLLTAIVEEVSGQKFEDFLQENILAPLEMRNTGLDVSQEVLPMRASGYSPSDDGIVNADYVNMAIPQGAGALYSTAADLLKWQRGLFGGKVLKAGSLDAMLTPNSIQPYGLGLIVQQDDGGETVWHSGGIEGFNSWLGYDRERDITVVVLANLNGGAANELGAHLMTLARGGEVTLAEDRATAGAAE